ncbi:hypothetical protein Molly5_55 [Maribacter phage Molly_5]|uniref:Uncharacterized protein n=1 Tax=Maribacter phage Molly_1 TaxID=2745685 RepID=A0A8E4UYE5_9CAUD|nr:hypothetical protein M1M29_gp055 [Maribacter phage Molly_1]QQO97739.1 hypothetical protein Molly2_55 [Maribacter phage Molly_2]QQO97939.1 hypothetical protein Molly3_55 [Maribacter phage Molly_3]QQO98139.1 hypothetical protein Molly4_55 [Maribacter phage Molly_4]QQO98339.1 hypothetical protein Molly5_55 [Maribacter phage Molly_5]QQO97539.1 hypothetical protein Molly1_55 [Maribacter phage Molly_1]
MSFTSNNELIYDIGRLASEIDEVISIEIHPQGEEERLVRVAFENSHSYNREFISHEGTDVIDEIELHFNDIRRKNDI